MARADKGKKREGDPKRFRPKKQLKGGDTGRLSDKHRLVLDEYFKNGRNQRKALLAAGYSESVARGAPQSIFHRADVQKEIERRKNGIRKKYELSEDFVIQRLMRIADANFGEIMHKLREYDYDLSVLTEEESYVIQEISDDVETITVDGEDGKKTEVYRKIKLKTRDGLSALDKLARKLGLYNDKVEHNAGQSIVELLQQGRNRVAPEEEKK